MVKAGFRKDFNNVLRELNTEITSLFARSNFKTFDGMTKSKLNEILRDLKEVQFNIYSNYTQEITAKLKSFMEADVSVHKRLLATVGNEPEEPEDNEEPADEIEADSFLIKEEEKKNKPIIPFMWFLAPKLGGDLNKVWSNILIQPLPANGVAPMLFLNNFIDGSAQQIENIVRKGYANKSDLAAVVAEIKGTKERNYRDGVFNKINNQSDATVATVVQHITSIVQAGLESIIFDRYQWISVIDAVTTQICRSRNLHIYEYGRGPLPPAHIRCRSKVKPYVGGKATPDLSFYEFMKSQPEAFQDDILGAQAAADLRSGKTKASDLEQFDNATPMTVDEFKKKLKLMLTR